MRTLGFPARNVAIALASAVTLGGCASYYGGYGGNGGYGGLSVGIGSGYYDPYYSNLGYYGGSPYWGWYDNYYYPGTGYYVYDRYRQPYRWTGAQQAYWTQRRAALGTTAIRSTSIRPNWSGFTRPRTTTATTRTQISRPDRQERLQTRMERRQSKAPSISTSTNRPRETRPVRTRPADAASKRSR
jgi:hypothetical protein